MKNIKLYLLLFITLSSSAQSVEDKLRDKLCECLAKEDTTTLCLKNTLAENESEINDIFEESKSDSSRFQKKYSSFKDFFYKNQHYFFKNCGNYLSKINKARQKAMDSSLKSCNTEKIRATTKYINENKNNTDFIKERSKCYISNKNYKLALIDLGTLTTKNPNDYYSYYLKAWVFEKMNRYIEASKIYANLYELMGKEEIKILEEISTYMDKQKNN